MQESSMPTLDIRPEKEADVAAISSVHTIAFGQENEARLVALLRQRADFIPDLSLVAVVDGNVVGHVLFSAIEIVGEEGVVHESLALAPIAVLPQQQQRGIGGELIRHGLAEARKLGYTSVIVLGHEHYYPRFGFVPAATWNIAAPFDVPSPVFMALELEAGSLTGAAGVVRYPKEFEAV